MGSDGMSINNQGNVYLTRDGMFVFNPQGNQIEPIVTDVDWTTKISFVGVQQNILLFTASKAVYSLKIEVKRFVAYRN